MDIQLVKMYLCMDLKIQSWISIIINLGYFLKLLAKEHKCFDIILVCLKYNKVRKQQLARFFKKLITFL